MCRLTKKELLEACGQTLSVITQYVALKYRYDCLKTSFDVIKGENRFSGGSPAPKEREAFLRCVRNEGYDVAVKTMLNPLRDWKRLVYYNLPSFVRKKLTG